MGGISIKNLSVSFEKEALRISVSSNEDVTPLTKLAPEVRVTVRSEALGIVIKVAENDPNESIS